MNFRGAETSLERYFYICSATLLHSRCDYLLWASNGWRAVPPLSLSNWRFADAESVAEAKKAAAQATIGRTGGKRRASADRLLSISEI